MLPVDPVRVLTVFGPTVTTTVTLAAWQALSNSAASRRQQVGRTNLPVLDCESSRMNRVYRPVESPLCHGRWGQHARGPYQALPAELPAILAGEGSQ